MKHFYPRFKIFLLTFALGITCVSLSNAIYQKWMTIPVDLPQVESSQIINVFVLPKPKRQICTWESEGYCYCSPHGKGIKGSCEEFNEQMKIKDIEDEKNGVF